MDLIDIIFMVHVWKCFHNYELTILVALLIGTGLLYCIFVIPMLIQEEIFPRWYNIANVPIFGTLWIFTICMVFNLSFC
jgi:hypothetical protein